MRPVVSAWARAADFGPGAADARARAPGVGETAGAGAGAGAEGGCAAVGGGSCGGAGCGGRRLAHGAGVQRAAVGGLVGRHDAAADARGRARPDGPPVGAARGLGRGERGRGSLLGLLRCRVGLGGRGGCGVDLGQALQQPHVLGARPAAAGRWCRPPSWRRSADRPRRPRRPGCGRGRPPGEAAGARPAPACGPSAAPPPAELPHRRTVPHPSCPDRTAEWAIHDRRLGGDWRRSAGLRASSGPRRSTGGRGDDDWAGRSNRSVPLDHAAHGSGMRRPVAPRGSGSLGASSARTSGRAAGDGQPPAGTTPPVRLR